LKLTSPYFNDHEIQLLKECLNSGWVTQGPLTVKFEKMFSDRHKIRYALATTSCTAALHLATLSLGLGPGDEVIVPAFTWVTSAHCAEYVGAKPIFADIDLATYNLDPASFEAAITPRTRAVVVVHLFGLSAKMTEMMAIAGRHKLFVIEDAACAIGTTYDGWPVGGIGDMGCFSFHPRKIISTGEGGMVTTNREELAEKVRCLRNHGSTGSPPDLIGPPRPYTMATFNTLGYNLRLSDIQAAVGIAQVEKLDGLLGERKKLALDYTEMLEEVEEIVPPITPEKCGHTYQSYVIRLKKGGMTKRNQVMECLAEHEIETRPGTHAVHRLGYYREKYRLNPEMFPNACLGEDTTITLPLFPGMTGKDQKWVTEKLKKAIHSNR
jgi:perosamine synthetase